MGRRRYSKGFVAIPFFATLAIGTLSDGVAALSGLLGATLGEDLFITSIKAAWSMEAHTAGEGPYSVGFHHSDLSVTELVEGLTAQQTDPDDIIANERGRRPARKVGTFSGLNTDEVLNDGRPIKTKIKWSVGDGHNPAMYCLSHATSTTTGTVINCQGTIFGRWQR